VVNTAKCKNNKTDNVRRNVNLRSVGATIVAADK